MTVSRINNWMFCLMLTAGLCTADVSWGQEPPTPNAQSREIRAKRLEELKERRKIRQDAFRARQESGKDTKMGRDTLSPREKSARAKRVRKEGMPLARRDRSLRVIRKLKSNIRKAKRKMAEAESAHFWRLARIERGLELLSDEQENPSLQERLLQLEARERESWTKNRRMLEAQLGKAEVRFREVRDAQRAKRLKEPKRRKK